MGYTTPLVLAASIIPQIQAFALTPRHTCPARALCQENRARCAGAAPKARKAVQQADDWNDEDEKAGKAKAKKSSGVDPRQEALRGVMSQIEQAYGRGSIQRLGDSNDMKVECTSTGCLTLDLALGGGLPKGRVVEVYGPESSGKTTLALHAIAEVQKKGGIAAFVDVEHALDPAYAAAIGVNVAETLISQPDSGEMALDVVDQLVRSSAVDIIVLDSVAALVPRQELEGDMADMQMGLQARLMSKALRKITGSLSKSHCTVVFLNQLRSKIGVIYGNPEVTSGGNALKYFSTVRLDIRRKEIMKDNSGMTVKVKVVKNKVAPPFRTVELDIIFGKGFDTLSALISAAEAADIVVKRGSWYSFEGENIAQGRLNTVEYVRNDKALQVKLEKLVRQALAAGSPIAGMSDGEEGEDEVPAAATGTSASTTDLEVSY